jgi:CSLREA domain-containing protein
MKSLLRRWFGPQQQIRKPLRRPPRTPQARLALETLEDRMAPAVVTVNTLADDVSADAVLTLREAITLVNAGTTAEPGNGLGRALTLAEQAQVAGLFGVSDAIRFETSPGVPLTGTIVLAGDELPFLDAAASIEGPGADLLAISGRDEIRALHVGARFIGTVSGLTLRDGPGGSGVLVQNVGRVSFVDCVIGPSNGTGLLNQHESLLTLNRVTVWNTSRGIDNFGNVELTSCTVSGNTNYGLYQQSHFPDSAIVRHSTITGNASALVVLDDPAAGGIDVIAGAIPALLENSIVAGNFRSSYNPETLLVTLVPSDVRGGFAAGSRFNLIGVDGGIGTGLAHGNNGNQVGTSAGPIDALLGPLAENGGTMPTHALLPGSPALGAGDPAFVPPPSVDQRGQPRVFGGRIDIGAVEDQTPPPPPQGPIIQGQHFLDLDNDGARDPGEPGLDGWTVQLRDQSGEVIAEQITHGIDHDLDGVIEPETESGFYRFTRVEPGDYVVSVVPQPGASQTFPRELHFGARTDTVVDNGPVTMATGDFTADAVLDLAVVNQQARNMTLLRNLGDGTYATHNTIAFSSTPTAIAAGDFDRDGDLDLAVTLLNNTVAMLRNNGAGVFGVGVPLVVGNEPLSIVAADLDEDGDTDLAVANFTGGTVSILHNDGAGGFTLRREVPVGAVSISQWVSRCSWK